MSSAVNAASTRSLIRPVARLSSSIDARTPRPYANSDSSFVATWAVLQSCPEDRIPRSPSALV